MGTTADRAGYSCPASPGLTPTLEPGVTAEPTATPGPTATPTVAPTTAPVFVTYRNFEIVPAQTTVKVGTTVTFLIQGSLHQPYNFTKPNEIKKKHKKSKHCLD